MSNNDDSNTVVAAEDQRTLLARLLRERASQARSVHPLSHGQKALWFLHQSAADSPAYNTAFAARTRSPIDVAALRGVFQMLITRHAALRTVYPTRDGEPVQEVHGYQELTFREIDASSWTQQKLLCQIHEDYERPLDLRHGPVLRVDLYTHAGDDHVLLVTLHHIACDAWSIWTLMRELCVLYPVAAGTAGRAKVLPPPKRQYHDFVARQDEMLASPEGERLWRYWSRQLSGELPVLSLPTDHPHPPLRRLRGASHFFPIPERLSRQLRELGKSRGATLYMTLLAAFHVLLHRYSGQDDIIVGSPIAGRQDLDFAQSVGYFANPIPLRADLSGDPTFEQFLGRVRRTVLDGLDHQDFPFPLLVERLQAKRDPSRSPVFQALFVLQKPPQAAEWTTPRTPSETSRRPSWGELELEPFDIPQMEGQFDLALEFTESEQALSGVLKYNTDLFEICDDRAHGGAPAAAARRNRRRAAKAHLAAAPAVGRRAAPTAGRVECDSDHIPAGPMPPSLDRGAGRT